ncbi:MAG: TRAP transporter fused permease subunit, partial [Peptococcaceae bacterium]|nr:TRAP transporter fused permease subunit [Peptococcaceae bacterium]
MKRFQLLIDCLAAAVSIIILAYLFGFFYIQAWNMYCVILIFFFALEYLPDFAKPELKTRVKLFSLLILICGIAPHIYLLFNIERIRVLYGTTFTVGDVVFGSMAAFAVICWVKRRFGWAMPIIGIVFILYVLFGHLLPRGMMGHAYYSFGRFVSFNFGDAAMYGTLMATCTRIIFLYMLFGSFLNTSGVGDYLIEAALVVAGRFRGGPAKVAVLSSALLGTINGNSVANVATTGAITIPLMKKTGYRPEFAGAVEAVASTGGQILPPVMGSGAFIMAEYLGISYSAVALAAALPALLYYLAVFLQVDLVAVRTGLRGAAPEDLPDKKETLKKIYMLLPIALMVYLLMIARVSVTRAGLLSILLTVVISWTQKSFRMGPRKIFAALADGSKSTVGIAAVCLLAGII